MRALFDVNVLLALFDPGHIHHPRSLNWWAENQADGWASCPLTQNGFLRVLSGRGYIRPRNMADALALLTAQTERPGHVFWSDDVSIMNLETFERSRLLGPRQITDIYLLALAVKNGGRLVTLDRSIPLAAVRGAEAKHLVVI
ncbi:MAG: TA system VapC family ribonuclease toxin [Variibacter sp.]